MLQPVFHQDLQFDFELKSVFEIIDHLLSENKLLKEARDILLPRLMTGIIDLEKMNLETAQPTKA